MIKTHPEFVTIRLLPAEAAQLKTVIAIESAKTGGRRIPMKDYIREMVMRAALRKQYVPVDRVVPQVKTSEIAQRISLSISPTLYEALNRVRGDGSARFVDGVLVVARANYGESDIVRELIRKNYEDAYAQASVQAYRKSNKTTEEVDTTACDTDSLHPRPRG